MRYKRWAGSYSDLWTLTYDEVCELDRGSARKLLGRARAAQKELKAVIRRVGSPNAIVKRVSAIPEDYAYRLVFLGALIRDLEASARGKVKAKYDLERATKVTPKARTAEREAARSPQE